MRRAKVRVRPLTGLLLVLLAASSALAWMQSRSSFGALPLLKVPSGSVTFRYEATGSPSAGKAAGDLAFNNARTSINNVATADAVAIRGADINMAEPIDDEAGVSADGNSRVYFFTTDVNNDLPSTVLAFAAAFHNTTTGEIVECDVAFNDADFDWNMPNPDLEGVAVHEFTHCYGISHSAVAGIFNSSGHEVRGAFNGNFSQQATMYPFHSGTTNDRSLHADDIAALSDLYPNGTTATMLGTISGNVQTGSGNPVLGAHVVAVSTAAPNTPVVGFLSNTDVTAGGSGAYRLLVPPGNYFVRVEPVLGFPNIFTQSNVFHPGTFQSNFPPEFYSGGSESASDAMPDNVLSDAAAVTVMAGQTTSGINIVVNNLAGFTNNNFSDARVISTDTFREVVDTGPATTEGTDPTGSCFVSASAFTAWYRFTAPANGTIIFSTEGSHYDTALAAFTGSPGAFTQVAGACSEDLGTPNFRSNVQSKITFSAIGGTTYHFLISDSQFMDVAPPEFLLVVNFACQDCTNPVPTLFSVSPSSRAVGSADFTLTVNGSSFINGSVVRWNGSNRATTFLSANQLQATIPASDLVNSGTAQVTVFNPAPGGGTSNSVNFTILSPVITGLVPDVIPATSPGFELAVSGSNFHTGSVVRWNGANRTTTFVSVIRLTATIPASDVAAVGTAQVTVLNSAGTGGTSNAVTFTINFRNPLPTITGLSPAGVLEDGPAFTLTVFGSNFIFNSTVQFDSNNRTTAFLNSSQLQASILASDITTVGTKSITVFTPGPGGGTSNTANFPVQMAPNLAPSTSGLAPNNSVAGSVRDTLAVQVDGSNFINGSVVRWNGSNRVTMFNSAMQLTATIPASDLVAAGTASVTVLTPGPGGGTSNGQTFTINNPIPVTSALSPNSTVMGDPGLTLTVIGSNFVPGSVVRWDCTNSSCDRTTTFIGNSQLRAAIPASDLAGAGMATVTVFTPTPGGGTSNGQAFTINSSLMVSSGASGGTAEPMRAAGAAGPTGARPAEATPVRPPALGPGSMAIPVLVELEELEPKTRPAGGGEFTLRVRGKNFLPGVVVRWNGKDLPTRLVSSTELEATVPARSVAAAGSGRITVFYPEASVESESKTFTVTSP